MVFPHNIKDKPVTRDVVAQFLCNFSRYRMLCSRTKRRVWSASDGQMKNIAIFVWNMYYMHVTEGFNEFTKNTNIQDRALDVQSFLVLSKTTALTRPTCKVTLCSCIELLCIHYTYSYMYSIYIFINLFPSSQISMLTLKCCVFASVSVIFIISGRKLFGFILWWWYDCMMMMMMIVIW